MKHRHILYVLAILCTSASGIAAQLFSGFVPRIAQDVLRHMDQAEATRQVGSYGGSSFLFGWAIGAFALGWMSDKIGRKAAYFISVLIATSSMLVISFAATLPEIVIIRFIMGIGVGSVLAQSVVMISEAFPTSSRSIVVGILINAFPMGFIGAGLIMKTSDDWRVAYQMGSITILLAIAVLLIVRESKLWSASKASAPSASQGIWHPMYRRDLVVAVILFGSMLLGIWAVLGWMPTYVAKISLQEHSQNNRSLINIMLGAGNVTGGLFSGMLSNRIGRRRAAAIGYGGCIVTTLLTLQTGLDASAMLFAGVFSICVFIGLNQGILSGYIPELFPTLVRGAATGLGMNVGRIITAVGVFFLGAMVMHIGGYHHAISLFALAYGVGLATLLVARETRGEELPL